MRVNNINPKEFLECLEVVGNAVSNKPAIQCLSGVLMKFEENKITLLGSDNSTSIKKVIFKQNEETTFEVVESGNCLVDYKTLKLIISKLDLVSTSFYTEGNQFIILNEKNVYKLNMWDFNDYPNIDFKKLENEIVISTNDLRSIISNTTFACSTNLTRPVLTGVNFSCKGNELTTIATDALRLSKFVVEVNNANNVDFNFSFPKQSLLALEKIINKTKQEKITLLFNNKNNILINVDNTLYKTRFLDGAYPDFTKVLELTRNNTCKINRAKLINSIDRISVLATRDKDNNYSVIKLRFKDGCLEVLSNNSEIGNAKNVIECDCKFDLELNCSSSFLLESLNVFEKETVNIETIGELKPFFITEEDNEKLVELLLPVKQL